MHQVVSLRHGRRKRVVFPARHSMVFPLCLTIAILLTLPTLSRPVSADQTTQLSPPATDAATIDQCNPSSTYLQGYILNYYNILNLECQSREMETWLKYDISGIPPGATILQASLTATLNYSLTSTDVGVYYVSDNSWNQSNITWNNAPLSSVSSSPLSYDYVSNETLDYSWDVTAGIASALSAGNRVSFILLPTSSQGSNVNGWDQFYPTSMDLSVTYSYTSVSVSLSVNPSQYGSSVTVTGTTSPLQSQGTFELQYSTDLSTWITFDATNNGSGVANWNPPSIGTFYFRGVWQTSWNGGSYMATSGTLTLSVTAGSSSIQLVLSQSTVSLGEPVTLTAYISPGSPSDGTVVLQESTDGVTWSTLTSGTPQSGAFSYPWSPSATGTYYLRATWSGDQNLLPSTSAQQILTVNKIQTTVELSAPLTTQLDQSISITGTLIDAYQQPISDAQITFQFGSSYIGTGVTGSNGSATVVYTPTVSAGSYTIIASYGGSEDYTTSVTQTQITIVPWKLTISSTAPSVPLIEFNGQTYVSDVTGQITILVNSSGSYSLSANSPLTLSSGVRAVFVNWGDGVTSASRTIEVSSDVDLTLGTKVQYLLTLQSDYGNPGQSGWYDAGSSAKVSVQSPLDQGNGTRRVFSEWVEDNEPVLTSANGTVSMSGATSLQAIWEKQYLVSVYPDGGNATGGGWYDAGATATVVVSPTTYGFLIQQVFNGWQEGTPSQDGVSTFTVNGPVNLHALWRSDYTQLIILLIVVGGAGGGGAGGYVWIRRRKATMPSPAAPTAPAPSEPPPNQVPRVEQRQAIETGTSVYAPSPCPKCGLANPMGAIYCAYCGADLNPQ